MFTEHTIELFELGVFIFQMFVLTVQSAVQIIDTVVILPALIASGEDCSDKVFQALDQWLYKLFLVALCCNQALRLRELQLRIFVKLFFDVAEKLLCFLDFLDRRFQTFDL